MFLPDEAGNIRTRYENVDAANIHPLVLAYIGDAYFHLYVRMRLLSYEQTQVQALHAFSAQIVSALWQARAYRAMAAIIGIFEQEEASADDGLTDALMELIIGIRQEARAAKNWAVADKIRDGLKEAGVVLEDTPTGVRWKRA